MSCFSFLRQMSSGLAIAFMSAVVGGQAVFAAELMTNPQASSPLLIAYDNACDDGALEAGDKVVVEGETYELAEDDDGLYIEYDVVDDEGNTLGDGTISVAMFDSDCETVHFEQVEGLDHEIVGDDVDE